MKLSDHRVSEFLAALRSPEPAPGGGSASALAGAVGASLLAMVAGLPRPRAAAAKDLARLAEAGAQCTGLSTRLASLIDSDSEAYELVVAAFRLPKGTEDEKARRGAAIQQALGTATGTPLEVMRACEAAIEQAAIIAAFGNRNASSDVGVGLELLRAGLRGAQLNVEVNLGSIKDAAFAAASRDEAARLEADAETAIAKARQRLIDER